ncbi:hypothetical protein RND81_12G018400 [Saponaria officinalis]
MWPKLSKVLNEQEKWEIKSHMKDEKWVKLFCTLFENYEFDQSTLVQLWIASGFMWGRYKDYIGDWCFENLLWRGYIRHCTTCYPNEKKLYKVDVTRLMEGLEGLLESKELHLRLKDHHFEGSEHVQRLALVGDAIDEDTFNVTKFKELKTLLLLCKDASNINTVPDDLLALKHLEVLDLSRTQIKELPDSIENLVDLRYLDLSFTLIELLPEAIDCLSKLQTLKLNDCRRLLRLPEGTRKLTSLEHLELDVLNQLPFMPRGIGSLTQLKSLSAFLIDKDEGRSIAELKNMNHLTGRLCISGLENVVDGHEARKADLWNKDKLTELEFRWDESKKYSRSKNIDILEMLRPSFQLEKLQLSYCNASGIPSWIDDPSFDKLTSIILFKCNIAVGIDSLQQLPSLKSLSLIDMLYVVFLTRHPYQHGIIFPKLQRLTIVSIYHLYSWDGIMKEDYLNLSELIIERCWSLFELPSPILKRYKLKHLEVINCSNLDSFLDKELSTSLATLIIEDCPKINKWIKENKDDWRKNIKHVENVYIDQDED